MTLVQLHVICIFHFIWWFILHCMAFFRSSNAWVPQPILAIHVSRNRSTDTQHLGTDFNRRDKQILVTCSVPQNALLQRSSRCLSHRQIVQMQNVSAEMKVEIFPMLYFYRFLLSFCSNCKEIQIYFIFLLQKKSIFRANKNTIFYMKNLICFYEK